MVRRIGGGGFGAVYEARHTTLGNPVAVKILHPKLASNPNFFHNFQKEAMMLAELRHENVVQVLDFGREDRVGFYLIMEWLEGHSLAVIRRKHPKPNWGWLFTLFSQLLDALDYAHERGIVHRDLKPDNLLITWGGRGRMILKIVDFGIATIVESTPDTFTPLPQGVEQPRRSATVAGTAYYMAPEQVKGEIDRMGPHTDIYACGILLGELLTGKRVFQGRNPVQTMRMQVEMAPPSLKQLDPQGNYSESLEHLFQAALQKYPHERFASAHELYTLLKVAFENMGIRPVQEDIYRPQSHESPPSSANLYRPQTSELHSADARSLEDLPSFASMDGLPSTPSLAEQPSIPSVPPEPQTSGSSNTPWILLAIVFIGCLGTMAWLFVNRKGQPTRTNSNPQTRVSTKASKGSVGSLPTLPRLKNEGSSSDDKQAPKIKVVPRQVDSDDDDDEDDTNDSSTNDSSNTNKKLASRRRIDVQRKRRGSRRSNPSRKRPVKRRKATKVEDENDEVLLDLRSRPSGSQVLLNKEAKGKTPLKLKVKVGQKIVVSFKKVGYVTKSVRLRPKRNRRVTVQLIEDLF